MPSREAEVDQVLFQHQHQRVLLNEAPESGSNNNFVCCFPLHQLSFPVRTAQSEIGYGISIVVNIQSSRCSEERKRKKEKKRMKW